MKIPPLSALLGLPIFAYMELRGYLWDSKTDKESVNYPNKAVHSIAMPVVYGAMLFVFVAALSAPPAEFIYFQF